MLGGVLDAEGADLDRHADPRAEVSALQGPRGQHHRGAGDLGALEDHAGDRPPFARRPVTRPWRTVTPNRSAAG